MRQVAIEEAEAQEAAEAMEEGDEARQGHLLDLPQKTA